MKIKTILYLEEDIVRRLAAVSSKTGLSRPELLRMGAAELCMRHEVQPPGNQV